MLIQEQFNKLVEYIKINSKLTNIQLNKLKKAVKSNEGAT